jgi:cytochrome c-type biogenesis protein CcmF
MWTSIPSFGSALLLAVMAVASYTFAVSVVAGVTGRVRTLQAARLGAYGTSAMVGVAVLALAYAFVSHDFRVRYVAHYSDRGMDAVYLFTALWGGQDGSLLWWLFLLALHVAGVVWWFGRRYIELQPYVIATLMGIVLFFCVLMAFSANPFSTSVAGARADGEGLNPLLQNFYMIIHPPSLYMGFVGCSVPFAFAIAALVTGRLDQEWIVASRKWTLFAWMFLAIGNTLGMLWAYEELGWGGYWAWDPVENAAFMPLLSASAYLHSVMIQERRGMLKVWNAFLICLTFFMTIFGTFLTRSGAIASVHSFAQSSIGTYFAWFLGFIAAFAGTLVMYRWPELRDLPPSPQLRRAAIATGWFTAAATAPGVWLLLGRLQLAPTIKVPLFTLLAGGIVYAAIELVYRRMTAGLAMTSRRPQLESVLSREFTFLLNNWALLGFMLFVLVATTFPMLSEALYDEKVTVGPPYYNAWVQPIGLTIFFLMGFGTLLGWKKTSPEMLKKAFRVPVAAMVAAAVLHFALGGAVGFPAVVWGDAIYAGALGQALRAFNAYTPVLGVSLCAFNASVIAQEFVVLFRSRAKTGANKEVPAALWWAGVLPGFLYTMITLPPPSRRRFGGYIVHFGIVLMFMGFTGKSWTIDRETTLGPGQSYAVKDYVVQYVGPRREVDNAKNMIFADVKVTRNGTPIGGLSPAKFIFKKMPDSPTTEVAMLHTVRDDLYLVVGNVSPQTKLASFQIHVNPLVSYIWLGCLVLIAGSVLCMWPQLAPQESRAWAVVRGAAGAATSIILAIVLAAMPAPAWGQGTSSLHSGTVKINNDVERDVFSKLRCMCGTCERLELSTCACGWADDMRERIREKLARGEIKDKIIADYKAEFGSDALSVPPNTGAFRTIYAFPLAAIVAGGVGLAVVLRRWRSAKKDDEKKGAPGTAKERRDDYDARLDDELKDLDG